MGQKLTFPREFIVLMTIEMELEALQAEVFMHYFIDGFSTDEIAQHLNIRPNTVNKRMSGVYKTFGIEGECRGKMRELRRSLVKQLKKCTERSRSESTFTTANQPISKEEEIRQLRKEVADLTEKYEAKCKEVALYEEETEWDDPKEFLDNISQRIVDRERSPLELLGTVGIVLPQLVGQWSMTSNIHITRETAITITRSISDILSSIESGVLPQDAD